MGKASQTGGVKPMNIAGRYVNERERLIGMNDAERAFRKQWLKDQELSPNEPRNVPELYKATHNPIRRFYRWPLDQLEKALVPRFGPIGAATIRYTTSKIGMAVALTYWMWYYYKYNSNNWEKKGGVKALVSRQAVVPGDPNFPKLPDKNKGSDYATRGFDKVNLNL